MAQTLVHRGPDDFGYLLADTRQGNASASQSLRTDFVPDLLLANRRLSILDLTIAGRQPIANETNDIFLVFNGAIHNYVELRLELEGFGHVFGSHTDTEVIVHAYEQWGPDCANRFNGMWAYAIWDLKNQRLVCSRDRFGIKPLVIANHGGDFFFASEAKAVLAAGVPASPNPRFLREHLSYDFFVPCDETAYSGVTQVPAGHNLVVTRTSQSLSRYWSYTDQSESYDYRQPKESFRELFDDAVRLRLRSDVPIAVLLSGGIDSAAVAAQAAAHQEAGRFETFTAAFPGYVKDEQRHAAMVAESRGLPHNVIGYDSRDLWADLKAVSWAVDKAPLHGQLLVRWHLLSAVSKDARIVLEGQGADEMLGGYPARYLKPYAQSEIANLRPWNLYPRLWRALLAQHRRKGRGRSLARTQRRSGQTFNADALLSPEIAAQAPDERPAPEPMPHLSSALHQKLWQDHTRDWLPHILDFGDSISMAHSVESRLPFLDHRLVEFSFGLPFDQLIRGNETKFVLRRSMAGELPTEIVGRRDKIGFETPTASWMRSRLDTDVQAILQSPRLRNRGVFNLPHLDECARLAGTHYGCARLLFLVCGLEAWFRQCIDGDGFGDLPDSPGIREVPTIAGHDAGAPGDVGLNARAV